MKPNKYLLFLLGMVVAYTLFEYYRPKPIDWNSTYQNNDKIPFGTNALYDLLPSLMQQPAVTTVRLPIFNQLTEQKLPAHSNYIIVARDFAMDKLDARALFGYVQRGNNVFISAYELPDTLGKVLGFAATLKAPTLRDTTLVQNFVNPQLRTPKGYIIRHDDGRNFLIVKKLGHITVLARNARHEPIFIRAHYGKGFFLIHNLPLALTNYYLLDPPTADHASKVLSYLPAWPTYWDEYQKQGRFSEAEQSIFRYIRTQPALNWAYYVVVLGLIAYALLGGKRTQRVIPVVEPPRNTSLEFVQTIGRLYFQQHDHTNLGHKKISYFLANIRERYSLNTIALNQEFADALAHKSGADPTDVAELVRLLRNAQKTVSLSEYDLLTINQAIENFNQHV